MNRIVATFLLIGYLTLVPFCFFGGALMANMDMEHVTGSPMHQMNGCEMVMEGCAQSSGMSAIDLVAHHVGMYLSISQTPLVMLSLFIAVALSLLFVISVFAQQLSLLFARPTLRLFARGLDDPCSKARQYLLTWLSLFETSPTFA
jgi:hypothetical protein